MAGRELAAVFRVRDEGGKELARIKNEIGDVEHKMGGLGPAGLAAGAGIGIAVTAAVALGKAMFDLGAEIDSALDTIAIRSGETGAALEGLQDDFRAVAATSVSSMGDVATAIGLLSARTGQSGEDLQGLASQVLNLSRITGTDLGQNIREISRAFGDWGIAAEQQSLAMDKMFVASQKAGVPLAELMRTVTQFSAPMRQLGFDFDETVSIMAKFEREGVNTETVMGTMRIALAKFAEVGMDPADTLERLIVTIRDLEDPIEATSLAMDVFGKRGGADMAAAIREGRFAIDDMVDAVRGAGGAINETAEKTDDAKQRWETAMKAMKLAAEPAATGIFELAGSILDGLIPAIEKATPKVQKFAEDLAKLRRGNGEGAGDVAGAVARGALSVVAPLVDVDKLGQDLAAIGEMLDQTGRALPGGPGTNEAENRRIAEENWGAWAKAQEEAARQAAAEVEAAVAEAQAAATATGAAPLTDAEIAKLRKDTEAEKEAARLKKDQEREAERARKAAEREAEREAKAAAREAERIIKEAQRQAEREAEIEAQRINTIRELGEKRARAIEEAENAYTEAWQNALDKTDEQIAKTEAQFQHQREIAAERQRLTDEMNSGLQTARDIQGGRRLGTQQTQQFEDRDIRRQQEMEDLLDRQAKRRQTDAVQSRKDQDSINAARFSGNSLAVLAAMKAVEDRKRAVRDQDAEENAAMAKRFQREDEAHARAMSRQAESLIQARADAAEIEQIRKDLAAPLEAFNQKILEDNLAEKIQEYYRAQEAALVAAENTAGKRITQAEEQFNQGVERANNIGVPQTVILNNYNYGVQGPDAIHEMIADDLAEAADALRVE